MNYDKDLLLINKEYIVIVLLILFLVWRIVCFIVFIRIYYYFKVCKI